MRKSLRQSLMIAFICGTSSPWLSSAFYIWLHFLSFSPELVFVGLKMKIPEWSTEWLSEWASEARGWQGLKDWLVIASICFPTEWFWNWQFQILSLDKSSDCSGGQKFRLLGYSKSWGPYWTKCNLSWLCHFLSQFTFCSRNLPEWINFLPYNNMGYISGQI